MKNEYTHQKLGTYIDVPAGYYMPTKEALLDYKGRQVLYVMGEGKVEASCCGVGCFGYIQVPGYVVEWKTRKNENDLPVSEVEPVTDEGDRVAIRGRLQQEYSCSMIDFS